MRKSSVLILVYLVIVVVLALSASLVYMIVNTRINFKNIEDNTKAFYLAEAGLDYGVNYVKSTFNTSLLPYTKDLGEGSFTVSVSPLGTDRVKIVSTGTIGNLSRTLEAYLKPDVYSRYAYFTDSETFRIWWWWTVPVWFTSNDYLDGPVYTNEHYNISGDPVFDGPVKSHDDYINYMHGGPPNDNPQFNRGLELGAAAMPMPTSAPDLENAAQNNGLYLTGKTLIVFNNDGTLSVTNANKGWNNHTVSIPDNGAVFVSGGNVYVRGTLGGRVSVGTDRNIIVTGNIVYNDDPRTNPDSEDMLALIAERNVVVSTDDDDGAGVYDSSAPYNTEIDATIMALGDSFIVENWYWVNKGTLTIYGGVIQKNRGPVGTFDSSTNQKISGYSKDYHYDPRLATITPPYYPRTGDWTFLSWKED